MPPAGVPLAGNLRHRRRRCCRFHQQLEVRARRKKNRNFFFMFQRNILWVANIERVSLHAIGMRCADPIICTTLSSGTVIKNATCIYPHAPAGLPLAGNLRRRCWCLHQLLKACMLLPSRRCWCFHQQLEAKARRKKNQNLFFMFQRNILWVENIE